MPEGLTVRRAGADDAERIAVLCGELGYDVATTEALERLELIADAADRVALVAEDAAGEVTGWVHAFESHPIESPAFAEIGGLIVASSCRGHGVGRALVKAVENWARQRGVERIRVRSRLERIGADRFYRAAGFEATKRQRVYDKQLTRPGSVTPPLGRSSSAGPGTMRRDRSCTG